MVELLTTTEINKLLPAGASVQKMIDVVTRKEFNVCFGGHRGDHYDVTPQTEADARIMEQIVGRTVLNVWRPARPTILHIGKRKIAWGQCYYMHHIRIGGGNPGSKYPSRNEAGPPWNTGGHACGYACNSIGGAGDAPNAACSKESNDFAMLIRNGKNGGQARAAAHEAFILGNIMEEDDEMGILLDAVRARPGCKNATVEDIAKILGYSIANSKVPGGDTEEELGQAISAGIFNGKEAGMPMPRWQGALMSLRAASNIKDNASTVRGED